MSATYALIPAAGRAARFRDGAHCENKLFAPLCGQPVLRRTVEAFSKHDKVDGIVVVTGAQDVARCREILSGLAKVHAIVPGGETRQESVAIGLFALGGEDNDLILVHDGARPLVTPEVIDRCITNAREYGNAVAALPVTDTLKAADSGQIVTRTVDREGLWAVQTPQAFLYRALAETHVAARDAGWSGTDEASLIEQFGDAPVHLVAGAAENLKITRPEDLQLAEALWLRRNGTRMQSTRVGFGYDIHRLTTGRLLVLGGIEIPSALGLDGHSDADVLLHALCDALLGAAGLPDIGTLFPNTDSAYENIDSTKLLAEVVDRVKKQSFTIVNVDLTLIAEAPKIAPFIPQMRTVIAGILNLEPTSVGIKATTNEGLGALGQGMGIAAHAVAAIA